MANTVELIGFFLASTEVGHRHIGEKSRRDWNSAANPAALLFCIHTDPQQIKKSSSESDKDPEELS